MTRTFECIDSHRRNQDFVLEGVYLPAAWGKFSLEIFRYIIVKTNRLVGGGGVEPLNPKGGCATVDSCLVWGFQIQLVFKINITEEYDSLSSVV